MPKRKTLKDRLGLNRDLKKSLGLDQSLKKKILSYRPSELPIGFDRTTGEPTSLNFGLLKTHMHIIGRTGTGKTRFLALLAQQLLQRQVGGCLIDIQGGLYHLMENYIAHHPELAEKVIFLNPGEAQDPAVAFNPLKHCDYLAEPQILVNMAIEAIMKHMQQAGEVMPTFKNISTQVFSSLVASQYTFLESKYFVDWQDTKARDEILKPVQNRDVLRFWNLFDAQSKREKKIDLLSFANRLNEFVGNKMLEYTLGRTDHLLDFQELVDEDKFLMVNLRVPINLEFSHATLIGIFLIHQIFYYCVSRHEREAHKHPFILMIDEMQNFITPDLVRILDQCRQKGLHLVLAHQRLQQLREQDTDLYSAVMDNARTKVIFAVPYSDAELLAPELTQLDFKKVKHELHRTAVLDYELEYHTAYHSSSSVGSTSMSGSSSSQQTGHTWPVDSPLSGGHEQVSNSQAVMNSYGTMESYTEGESQVPMLMPILGKELSSRTFYTPEELRYQASWELKSQDLACAVIKRLEEEPQLVKMQRVPDYPFDEKKVRAALEKSRAANPDYYLPLEATRLAIEARQQALEIPPQATEPADEDYVPKFKPTGKIK